ncbi:MULTISPECIES: hypothetical protein [Acinetobacter]|uniref:Phage tail protein C-terminal domain-containing protein n=1 Tax=Acinetobacter piscicola TaxID=2006115 RepID=A0A7S7AHK9_9GAMM|nr:MULTISPECIES: hypothetical protein [Acinetobacter]QOW45796.1 hypothetical protein G0028_07755 [Acinetobacter piscicola]
MAIQTINLGSTPTGAGGDTFRSTGVKVNENFTNNTHAASRMVGTEAGNVMEVGAFGLGRKLAADIGVVDIVSKNPTDLYSYLLSKNGGAYDTYYHTNNGATPGFPESYGAIRGYHITNNNYSYSWQIFSGIDGKYQYIRSPISATVWGAWYALYTAANTTVDSNGFIKKASPIIKLFAGKIEANEEAFEQNPNFEKVSVGHYLLKNTEGFSDNGWYIEMPKDANGNVLVAVQYQQLEDDTIEVKTFAKKFDEDTGDIVPNLEKPRDIPTGRWIDIRLKALLQPKIKISDTPIDFQPTNLAQAVSEALKDDAE